MKKIITALIVTFFVSSGGIAQVIITPQLPQTGIKLKTQLWNLGLSNSNVTPVSVKLSNAFTPSSAIRISDPNSLGSIVKWYPM